MEANINRRSLQSSQCIKVECGKPVSDTLCHGENMASHRLDSLADNAALRTS